MDEMETMAEMEAENTAQEETAQEPQQGGQEAAVAAETATGEETDAQEPEAAQEQSGPGQAQDLPAATLDNSEELSALSGADTPDSTNGQENGSQEEAPEADLQETQEAPQEEPVQEPQQDGQEAAVAAETGTGEETDAQEPEAAQEAENGQEGGEQAAPAVITPTPTLLGASNGAEEEEQETDEEYETLPVNALDVVKLGRQGEHLTQQVQIDCSAWLGTGSQLIGCQLLIAAIRPGENTVYLPTVSVADGVITWDIQEQDTAKGGWGRGEVRAMLDGKIKKSAVFRTRVEPSLEGSGSAPITPPDWVQEILDSVAAAQTAAEQAAASAAQAELNTRGLAGWSLTKEQDDTVSIDYNEESEE